MKKGIACGLLPLVSLVFIKPETVRATCYHCDYNPLVQVKQKPTMVGETKGLTEIWDTPMADSYIFGESTRVTNGIQEEVSTACCELALKEK